MTPTLSISMSLIPRQLKNISSLINFDENIDFMIHFIKLLLDNKLYNFFYDADENILLYKGISS